MSQQTPPRNKKPIRRRDPEGWDALATWYDGWVGKDGSQHHRQLALPAVIELLAPKRGELIVDLGAGQGVLAPLVHQTGARYIGVDVSPKLLALARKHHGGSGKFIQADVAQLSSAPDFAAASADAVVFLLSIQDMDPLDAVLQSAAWLLKPNGRAVLLMTHPAFRIPRQSGWGYDENRKLQYRRIDRYITPLPVPMKQHPGRASGVSISFHRPISAYLNGLAAVGLLTDQMLEIPLGRASLKPERSAAERLADDEIPLFLALRAYKLR